MVTCDGFKGTRAVLKVSSQVTVLVILTAAGFPSGQPSCVPTWVDFLPLKGWSLIPPVPVGANEHSRRGGVSF